MGQIPFFFSVQCPWLLMSFTGKFFYFCSDFCKLFDSMALFQMGCSHKRYIMSLNVSKHNTLDMKWGERESKTPTQLHHPLSKHSQEESVGSRCLQGVSAFCSDQEVRHERSLHTNLFDSKISIRTCYRMPVH